LFKSGNFISLDLVYRVVTSKIYNEHVVTQIILSDIVCNEKGHGIRTNLEQFFLKLQCYCYTRLNPT